MDINPQSTKPISDDQELAKVLAGVNQTADEPLQFDTPPVITPPSATNNTPVATPTDNSSTTLPTPTVTPTTAQATPTESSENDSTNSSPATEPTTDNLSTIKQEALNDLRPLVDKLDIAPDEKFDTYLLLIRSTDDKSLIAPAYEAAQAIPDEARKAQALLDIIKEIDYLSNPQK